MKGALFGWAIFTGLACIAAGLWGNSLQFEYSFVELLFWVGVGLFSGKAGAAFGRQYFS